MIPVGTAVGFLALDYTSFTKGLDKAVQESSSLSGKFSSTIGQGLSSIGEIATAAGTKLTTAVTLPIAAAGAASIKFGAEFDKQMSEVGAVSGATTEQMEKMRDAAISWGEKTVYTATEAGKALYYMGLAGWSSEQSVAGLGSVLNLAAAGNLDLGRSSDIVTDAMTAMGYKAGELTNGIENTTYFTNALAAAMSNSNTDVDQLGEAFKYVAPLAGSLKTGVNDLSLALGLMANVGVKSSQAGTGLRQALKQMIAPTKATQKVMDEYGISLFDAQGNAKSMRDFLQSLRDEFGNTGVSIKDANGNIKEGEQILQEYADKLPISQQEKLNAIVELFGVRALPGMLGIIDQSQESFDKLADAIDNSNEAFVLHNGTVMTMEEAISKFGEETVRTSSAFQILGAAEGMAMMQMDNLQGDWIKFTSALGTAQIHITDLVKGSLRQFVQKLTELTQWFNSLDADQQKFILKIIAAVAAIGPLLLIFGKLTSGIAGMINNFHIISAAVAKIGAGFNMLGALVTGPMIAIAAAIAVVVGAVIYLWNTNEKFRNSIITIFTDIKNKVIEAFSRIGAALGSIGITFDSVAKAAFAVWDWFANALAPIFVGIASFIGITFSGVVDIFVGIVETIAGIIKGFKDGDWTDAVNGLKSILIGVVEFFAAPFIAAFIAITNYLEQFGTSWGQIWDGIVAIVKTVVDGIVAAWNGAVDFVATVLYNLYTAIWNAWNNAATAVADFLYNIYTAIVNGWNSYVNFITAVCDAILFVITAAWNGIITVISTVLDFISNLIVTVFEFIVTTIVNTITNIVDTVIKGFDAVKSGVETAITTMQQIISTIFTAIQTFISTVISAIVTFVSTSFTNMQNLVVTTMQVLSSLLTNIVNGIKTTFVNTVTNIKTSVSNEFTNMKNAVITTITNLASDLVAKVNKIKDDVKNAFNKIKDDFLRIGSDIVDGLWQGISDSWTDLVDNVKDLAGSLVRSVKGVLKINSPSKVFRDDVGAWIAPGIAQGFKDTLPQAVSDMENELNKEIKDFDTDGVDIGGLSNNFQSVVTDMADWFASIEDRLSTTVDNIKTDLSEMNVIGESLFNSGDMSNLVVKGKPSDSLSPMHSGSVGSNGETVNNFTFYSNKSIDEVEAARLLRRTQRDLAEGFL